MQGQRSARRFARVWHEERCYQHPGHADLHQDTTVPVTRRTAPRSTLAAQPAEDPDDPQTTEERASRRCENGVRPLSRPAPRRNRHQPGRSEVPVEIACKPALDSLVLVHVGMRVACRSLDRRGSQRGVVFLELHIGGGLVDAAMRQGARARREARRRRPISRRVRAVRPLGPCQLLPGSRDRLGGRRGEAVEMDVVDDRRVVADAGVAGQREVRPGVA